MNRRSPFSIGLFGAAGVGVAYLLARMLVDASSVLVLIGLALFLAIGLDPAVQWLTRRRLPRWAAVAIVALVVLGSVGGFLAAAVPPLIAQGTQFAHELPGYLGQLRDHSTTLGRLDARFHLKDRLDTAVLTSLIAGVGTFIWLVTFHVPYPILLAIAVAILDLIPVVGSTIGGILVSLIALTVSLPVAIATLAFYLAYAAAIGILLREVAFPKLACVSGFPFSGVGSWSVDGTAS